MLILTYCDFGISLYLFIVIANAFVFAVSENHCRSLLLLLMEDLALGWVVAYFAFYLQLQSNPNHNHAIKRIQSLA